MKQWYTVEDMLKYCTDNNLKLLSNYDADFWEGYLANSTLFDKLFTTLYKNYRYFNQDIDNEEETIGEVTIHFITNVGTWLMLNKKKYEELMRVEELADSLQSLFDEVDYKITDNGTTIFGQRQDSTSSTSGARVDTIEEQVSPFESTTYQNASKNTTNKGAETDSDSFTKGAETDTNQNIKEIKGKQSARSKDALIKEHEEVWNRYKSLLLTIFQDIAKEFLLI